MTALEEAGLGFGTIAFLGLIWNYVKMALGWLQRLFVETQTSQDEDFNGLMASYLNASASKKFAFSDRGRMYSETRGFVRTLRRMAHIIYVNTISSPLLYFWGPGSKRRRWPLVVNPGIMTEGNWRVTQYMYLRGSIDWKELTRLACEHDMERLNQEDETANDRYSVVRHVGTRGKMAGLLAPRQDNDQVSEDKRSLADILERGAEFMHWSPDELGPERSRRAFDSLSLTPELQDLAEEIKFWFKEEDWYESRGVPWRRGYLFEGQPGTGKTSYCRALGEELGVPIHIPDLSTMDNGELIDAWQKISADAPCIVLIEDIDAAFHGRENIGNDTLTFDCVLNCIDGVERCNGLLLIITTNHLQHVDPALGGPGEHAGSSDMPERPGRVDRLVHFRELDDAGRLKMARRILQDCQEQIDTVMERGQLDTAAQFQERCFRVALAQKYNKPA